MSAPLPPFAPGWRRRLAYWAAPLRGRLRPRRFHAYCVSAPRSGTHSVAGLLSHYRAAHEPDTRLLFRALEGYRSGAVAPAALARWLEGRDRTLSLEMESHNRLNQIPGLLARTFPAARFVLVVRDCYSWLESYLTLHLGSVRGADPEIARRVRDWLLDAERFRHTSGDQALAACGLAPLDAYLAFWATGNRRVLDEVPSDRLLVLRLGQLNGATADLARFLGVPPASLDAARAHLDVQRHKASLIGAIDRDYLEERVRAQCGDVMTRFFPEIRSLDDALGPQAPSR